MNYIEIIGYILVLIGSNLASVLVSHYIGIKRISKGLQTILRFEMENLFRKCLHKGFATLQDKATFNYLYEAYHPLGKNGVMDYMKDRMNKLPIEKAK